MVLLAGGGGVGMLSLPPREICFYVGFIMWHLMPLA